MRSLLLSLILFSVAATQVYASESIICRIQGGEAVAYYCNNAGGGSASGTFNIDVYDQSGSNVSSDFCIGIATSIDECSELCRVSAPANAFYCGASKR